MGWQPGPGAAAGASPDRDPRLAWFASDDGLDALIPSGLLAPSRPRYLVGGTALPGLDQ